MMAMQFKILMVEDEPAHAALVSRAVEKHEEHFDLDVADGFGPVAGLADLAFTEDF